jgi:hypothetical protein
MQEALKWERVLHREVPWAQASDAVIAHVAAYLDTLAEGATVSTSQLVEKLYPSDQVRGDAPARDRLFDILLKRKRGTNDPLLLVEYRTRGPEKHVAKKLVRGWLWHKRKPLPKRMICCPNCQFEWEAPDVSV